MPGPEQLIRGAVALPVAIVRRVTGMAWGLIPGTGGEDEQDDRAPAPADVEVEIAVAADDAMTREREPVEEAPLVPEDDLEGHVEPEIELVAESADPEATEPPGPDVHMDETLKPG